MPLNIPPELKKIAPFIKRAEELDKDKTTAVSRLVAFYCRQFAVQQGIQQSGSAEAKACLGEILSELEKEKAAMASFTRDEAAFLCRKFAEDIFNKADTEDRAGQASKSTARTFYASATFLHILEQFYADGGDEHAEEDKKRIVYSKWKSTEILKAIKEGREPTPGGYGENAEDDVFVEPVPPAAEATTTRLPSLSEAPAIPPPPPMLFIPPPPAMPFSHMNAEPVDEGTEVTIGPPPAYPGESKTITVDMSPSKSSKSGGLFGFGGAKSKKPSKAEFTDASELVRFALAAIEDKDADLAISRMKNAIAILERQ